MGAHQVDEGGTGPQSLSLGMLRVCSVCRWGLCNVAHPHVLTHRRVCFLSGFLPLEKLSHFALSTKCTSYVLVQNQLIPAPNKASLLSFGLYFFFFFAFISFSTISFGHVNPFPQLPDPHSYPIHSTLSLLSPDPSNPCCAT